MQAQERPGKAQLSFLVDFEALHKQKVKAKTELSTAECSFYESSKSILQNPGEIKIFPDKQKQNLKLTDLP